jgi:DNA-directed RNA polymerase specialized sigma24 family protein
MTKSSGTPQPSVLRTRGYNVFYHENCDQVEGYFRRRVGNQRELAPDLAAETLKSVYENQEAFRGSSLQEEQAWLYAIAKNRLFGYFRKARIERDALQRLDLQLTSDADFERTDDIDAAKRLADELLEDLKNKYPLHYHAVRLHIYQGLDFEAMARSLDETPAAMRKRFSDCLRYLRRILDLPES